MTATHTTETSRALFARAISLLPGGVDSPVRAFKLAELVCRPGSRAASARGYLETRVKTMSGVLSSGFP